MKKKNFLIILVYLQCLHFCTAIAQEIRGSYSPIVPGEMITIPAGGGYRVNQSAPVGSYPAGASPYGCMDMTGNAYEWCADYARSYPGCAKPYDYTGLYHVVKGGCWDDTETTTTYRSWYLPPGSAGVGPGDSDIIGLRMAR